MDSITSITPGGGLFSAFTSVISFLFRDFKLAAAAFNAGLATSKYLNNDD